MKKVTVIGATGMIGQPVTRELVNAGLNVTALVREIDRAKRQLPEKVRFVKGELQDINSIRESLKDAEGVFISIANTYKDAKNRFNAEQQGLDNILTVAKELNIKQVVLLSSFLARDYKGDWWVYRIKRSCIDRVKGSGLPYTIFYASTFMENFHNGMIRKGSVSALKSKLKNKSFWIAGQDFGRQVANSFETSNALNHEFAAQGPQAFSMEEAANEFARNYHYEKLTVTFTPRWMLALLGLFSPMINFMIKLSAVNMNSNEIFEAEETWRELGKPHTTIASFAVTPVIKG